MRKEIITLLLAASLFGAEFDLRGGLGYSSLSQKFVLFEEDTLFAENELKAFAEGSGKLSLTTSEFSGNWLLSYGSESARGRVLGRWRTPIGTGLKLSTELGGEFRTSANNELADYGKGLLSLLLKKKWAESDGSLRFSFETKEYSQRSSYFYDYNLSQFRVEYGFPFIGNGWMSSGYRFAFRFAPDTTDANYIRNDFYGSWESIAGANYYRLHIEAERRTYNCDGLLGDYWRAYGQFAPRISVGEKWTVAPEIEVEGYRFNWTTEIYPNRELIVAKLGVERFFGTDIRGAIAPKYTISNANKNSLLDKFSELSIDISANILRYKQIWCDATFEPGLRFYMDTSTDSEGLYSNFSFIEASVFSTFWILPRLKLDVVFSYSPEWHDIEDDDLTTLYFSSNIRYEFFGK